MVDVEALVGVTGVRWYSTGVSLDVGRSGGG